MGLHRRPKSWRFAEHMIFHLTLMNISGSSCEFLVNTRIIQMSTDTLLMFQTEIPNNLPPFGCKKNKRRKSWNRLSTYLNWFCSPDF